MRSAPNCTAANDQGLPCQLQDEHDGPHQHVDDDRGRWYWWTIEPPPSRNIHPQRLPPRQVRATHQSTAKERAEYSSYANLWSKYRPKTKTIQEGWLAPPERFATQYVDGIGWLTAREAEWFDDPDSNLTDGTRTTRSVDARFDTTAIYANPDDNSMAAWPITGREIRPKRVPWFDDDD